MLSEQGHSFCFNTGGSHNETGWGGSSTRKFQHQTHNFLHFAELFCPGLYLYASMNSGNVILCFYWGGGTFVLYTYGSE